MYESAGENHIPASAPAQPESLGSQESAPSSLPLKKEAPEPALSSSHTTQPQHKRVYQACIPCRRRKVRCDLGSVDNPHDPPCVRCRRESKECFFSATRRKRKTEDAEGEFESDEYVIRNGRKRIHASEVAPPIDRTPYSDVPLTPGGSLGRREPLRRPDGPHGRNSREFSSGGEDSNAQLANLEAQEVMKDRVYGPHDALDLLYKAATDRFVQCSSSSTARPKGPVAASASTASASPAYDNRSNMPLPLRSPATGTPANIRPDPSRASSVSISTPTAAAAAAAAATAASVSAASAAASRIHSRKQSRANHPGQSTFEANFAPPPELSPEEGQEEALRAWGRFRFVRAGWFTAQEAISYIDYYYTYLSPLTPISPPTFRNPASHITLLSEEPILTVTLLTITSRYMKLSGPGGHCRSNAIHEQLWTYLRGMIERCLWGQEAFGGRLHPSGPTEDFQTSSTAPWRGLRKGSLRTLGTIESLMILTEWHPRALHFPPAEAIDELMLPEYEPLMPGSQPPPETGSFGGKRIESWLEPAWRSDRMCWMLLSTAMGLAYELGVFDDIDELLRDNAVPRPEYEEEGYRQRAYRIKRLLLIYLTQLAGRLGWKNMVPDQLWKNDPAVSRKRRDTVDGMTPASHSSLSNSFNYIPDLELDDQIIHCWAGVSNAMHIGNERLFKSRQHTTEIIQSGKYVEILRDFQPMLQGWWNEFQRFPLPPYIRHILTIEYEYVRIYVNSLSLQAVVERCTNNAGNSANVSSATNASGSGSDNNNAVQLSPQTQSYYGKLPLGQLGGFSQDDQIYIRQVVDGCRNLLKTVVHGLLPKGYLKHAPVRTYFRIISGAMFLLKTFALGAPRSDVKISIGLMDEAVEALRNCVVDDVHLGVRFADLLETLTSRLRTRFIQAPLAPSVAAATAVMMNENGAAGSAAADQGGDAGAGAKPSVNSAEWAVQEAKMRQELDTTSPGIGIAATPFDLANFPFPNNATMLNLATPTPMDTSNAPGSVAAAAANARLPPAGVSSLPTSAGGALGASGSTAASAAASAGAGDTSTTGADAAGAPAIPRFDDWNGHDMWYLPPGAAFFQNMENNNVHMTAEGVNVGGTDLLDYMAMDTFPNIDGGPSVFL